MSENQTLTEKRDEAHRELLALKDETPTAVILNFFGRWFPESVFRYSPVYWLLQIVLINIVILLPGLLISLAFHEIDRWSSLIVSWVVAVELALFGFILAHTLFDIVFGELAHHIVYKMNNIEDISSLVTFCSSAIGNVQALFVAILWFIWTPVALISSLHEFVGYGLTFMTIPTGYLIGVDFQTIFWSMALSNQFKHFRYDLNTFVPANSEVISKISGILNMTIYLTGAGFAVLTLLVASGLFGVQINKSLGVPFTVLGCVIITIQFLTHRSTVNAIVEKERWGSLNRLQLQMNIIQATEDLSNKDVSERLLRLADLHERIRINRAGGFDAKSVLSLFSQLMLPLLGLLLGNIDKLMNFLR